MSSPGNLVNGLPSLLVVPGRPAAALLLLPGAVQLVPLALLEVSGRVELGPQRAPQHPPGDQGRRLGTGPE